MKLKIDKNRTINNIKSITKDNNIVLINSNNRSVVDEFYYIQGDSKQSKKFIKSVEGLIRKSEEYSNYIRYLSTIQGINSDALMANITSANATLEFHHYPFTLYDIVEIVLNHNLTNNIKFTSITLAEEVMKLHYDNIIGVTRLSNTVHQLTHAGEVFIPLSSIFGDVNEFINRYYDSIYSDQIEKYNKLIEIDSNGDYSNQLVSNKTPKKKEENDNDEN